MEIRADVAYVAYVAYVANGVVAYLLMRAIGELFVHSPSDESFGSQASHRLACRIGWGLAIVAVRSVVLPWTSSTWWISLTGTVPLLDLITVGYEFGTRRCRSDETQARP